MNRIFKKELKYCRNHVRSTTLSLLKIVPLDYIGGDRESE